MRLVVFSAILAIARSLDVTSSIDISMVLHVTDERYLSVTMGPTVIRHNWGKLDPTSQKFHTLAKALAPAIFRVGGSEADLLIFNRTAPPTKYSSEEDWMDFDYSMSYDDVIDDSRTNFTMNADQWNTLNEFTASVGWNLLFDLNVLLRRGIEWDSSNTLDLLKYSIQKNYTGNLNLELGNEPNEFKHYINRTLDPTQLGKDFLQLHYLVKQSSLKDYFTNSILVGPDTTKPRHAKSYSLEYLRQYLKVAGESLSAITWHQYYMDGRTAELTDFLDPKVLALYPMEAARVKAVISEVGLSHKPLMMGETGSCWGGGAPKLSDRYAGGFLWLDKLGIAAQMGHSVVMRQTFYGGSYGLLNRDLDPTPDYWLSLLYKVLVGTRVLHTDVQYMSSMVRVYAHCTNTQRSGYPAGSVTVYILNLHKTPVNVTLDGVLGSKEKLLYWFTPHGDHGLASEHVNINGVKVQMVDDVTFPSIKPKVVPDVNISLPETSYGFIVIPGAQTKVCL